MSEEESLQLLQRILAKDAGADQDLFQKYAHRLVALAQSKLPPHLARRVDADDIVQSAFVAFFQGAKEGKFTWERRGDLWRLLAAITVNKFAKQRERHGAARRNAFAEQSTAGGDSVSPAAAPQAVSAEPTPEELAEAADEIAQLKRGLDDAQQAMLDMRLDGFQIEEIAQAAGKSERTVRRMLDMLKTKLQERRGSEE
jgi:RNA polymerase sigma factor (sigma-70 family)